MKQLCFIHTFLSIIFFSLKDATIYIRGSRFHDPSLQSPWWQAETIPHGSVYTAVHRKLLKWKLAKLQGL
jgi:hypothetical protein